MTVALGTTLIDLSTDRIDKDGWFRIIDRRVNGTDIFIGAIVTDEGETFPDVDLCSEDQVMTGIVIGENPTKHTLHANGPMYHDYDQCFDNNTWIRVGVPKAQGRYLVLSETNTTITRGQPLEVVTGVLKVATTGDNYRFIAEEAVTGASNTRKYLWARFIQS